MGATAMKIECTRNCLEYKFQNSVCEHSRYLSASQAVLPLAQPSSPSLSKAMLIPCHRAALRPRERTTSLPPELFQGLSLHNNPTTQCHVSGECNSIGFWGRRSLLWQARTWVSLAEEKAAGCSSVLACPSSMRGLRWVRGAADWVRELFVCFHLAELSLEEVDLILPGLQLSNAYQNVFLSYIIWLRI